MARAIRDKRLIPAHRAEIAKLYLQGKPIHEIAADMVLPKSIINDDLQFIRQMWLNSSLVDFDAKRSEEVARLNRVETEAWAEYERSKDRQVTERAGSGMQGSWSETETAERTGDPRYLAVVLKCIDRRIKIFGLDAPERSMNVHLEMIKVIGGVSMEEL